MCGAEVLCRKSGRAEPRKRWTRKTWRLWIEQYIQGYFLATVKIHKIHTLYCPQLHWDSPVKMLSSWRRICTMGDESRRTDSSWTSGSIQKQIQIRRVRTCWQLVFNVTFQGARIRQSSRKVLHCIFDRLCFYPRIERSKLLVWFWNRLSTITFQGHCEISKYGGKQA